MWMTTNTTQDISTDTLSNGFKKKENKENLLKGRSQSKIGQEVLLSSSGKEKSTN